ncbi:MAG: hypothetical protein PHU80_09000, partial [Kiritimatiellae bacterium]|nr:hypothetical protein [Kiritimatiellia bacterium]
VMKHQIAFSVVVGFYLTINAAQWYRGNLHMHSKWSDGNAMPEDAVAWYRDKGYQFVCLSDHQIVQTDTNAWLEVGSKQLSKSEAESYLKRYPASAHFKKDGSKEFIRLKTVWELKRIFDRPREFLMIPGLEVNRVIAGRQVHMNALNVHETIPYRYGDTPAETFARIENAVRAWGDEQQVPVMFMLNHPTWPYFDIAPDVLVALPQVRFFELCNADGGHVHPAHRAWHSMEKFWDIVNAFRIEDGHDPVFATATDDTHNYFNPAGSARPGEGWICVRAAELDSGSLLQSMYRGDFYASTGVSLDNVAFDNASGTLSVKVTPEAGLSYRIVFTTTKAGFDRATEAFDDPARDKKPARSGVIYSDDIGRAVKTEEGAEASYTLADDDLYVRATVVSSRRAVNRTNNEPEFDTAWTQPYGWRAWQRRNPEKSRLRPRK